MGLAEQVLRTEAFIAVRALEAAQWEIRRLNEGKYELPTNERTTTIERTLNHFRNTLNELKE